MEAGITELISRCKAGERQALDLLYQQYRPGLLDICKYYTKEDGVAEDLLHDAFVVILTSLDKLKQTDNPESWMTAIVRNVGYHYRQYVKKEQKALLQMAEESKLTSEETQVPDYDELQTLISQLPQGYQQVFRLSVFEGLSHQEISQLLGITTHSSSSQLSHAKRMLRLLIKQSWVLMLLLIAIPAAVWWLARKQTSTEEHHEAISEAASKQEPSLSLDMPEEQPHYTQAASHSISSFRQNNKRQKTGHDFWPTENVSSDTVVVTDSIPFLPTDSIAMPTTLTAETKEEVLKDTIHERQIPRQPDKDLIVFQSDKESRSWNVSLAYNGQVGQGEDFMAAGTINCSSFDKGLGSKSYQFSNWADYRNYLSTLSGESDDEETRSLMRIATQNTVINNGVMEVRYEHQPPVTLQLMFNRQLSQKASIETGLSYTQLHSTITTGSTNANIQERQKLRYVGIPIRFGWNWYDKGRFNLYSSAGPMLELPIHSTVNVRHIENGKMTFQKEASLSVPVQWSVSLGLGAQYNLTPYLGIYLEPSMQYFFNDGSLLKTYRTEHPLEFTLPVGLRFHW